MPMSLPSDILQTRPEEAVRRIALGLLAEAHAAATRLDDPKDGEALHDFRVAIRRLRSTLRAWRGEFSGSLKKKHHRALRELQKATGGGRDAEVALEWLSTQQDDLHASHRRGLEWLQRRLQTRLEKAMTRAAGDIRKRFHQIEETLSRRLERMVVELHLAETHRSPSFAGVLARRVREHGHEVVLCLTRATSKDFREDLHRARIRTKRLRYLVEPVRDHTRSASTIVKRCKRLQDVLGDLNDAHVLTSELGEAVEVAAAERARRLHRLSMGGDPDEVRKARRHNEGPGLLELTRRSYQRVDTLFEQLEKNWFTDGLDQLTQAVEKLALELEGIDGQNREIERKYLLQARPARIDENSESTDVVEIDQGWLPGDKIRERLRRTRRGDKVRYYRTIKLGTGLERFEFEEETDHKVFDALWSLTKGCRVRKRRYRIEEGGRTWEVDEFLDRKLYLAEVELPEGDTAVDLPKWLDAAVVREVTDDPTYVNLNLAC